MFAVGNVTVWGTMAPRRPTGSALVVKREAIFSRVGKVSLGVPFSYVALIHCKKNSYKQCHSITSHIALNGNVKLATMALHYFFLESS